MFKRSLDVGVVLVSIALLWPIFILLMIAVRIGLGSPVFFRQKRIGRHNRCFELVKFRTMTDQRDTNGELCPDDVRLTRFGRFLRSTSLDELPELYNILCGDMSLVGPRPLLVDYLPLYNTRQARRHEVRPGLTGWAQVNGRNELSWQERLELDVWYVENQSFALDLQILCRTFLTVIRRDGISEAGSATMTRFRGHDGE